MRSKHCQNLAIVFALCFSICNSQNSNNKYQYTVTGNGYQYTVSDTNSFNTNYIQNGDENNENNYYIPVIENGVPIDTPEVQRAKAEHFQLYAKAAAAAERANQRNNNYYRNSNNNRIVQEPYYYSNNEIQNQYPKEGQSGTPVDGSYSGQVAYGGVSPPQGRMGRQHDNNRASQKVNRGRARYNTNLRKFN